MVRRGAVLGAWNHWSIVQWVTADQILTPTQARTLPIIGSNESTTYIQQAFFIESTLHIFFFSFLVFLGDKLLTFKHDALPIILYYRELFSVVIQTEVNWGKCLWNPMSLKSIQQGNSYGFAGGISWVWIMGDEISEHSTNFCWVRFAGKMPASNIL